MTAHKPVKIIRNLFSAKQLAISKTALVLAAICGLGLIIYANTFGASFHFDDIRSIVNNFKIRDIGNMGLIFRYWPTRFITYFSFALNYHYGRADVFGYHLFNIATHLSAAAFVAQFVLLTLRTPFFKKEEPLVDPHLVAFFAGVIFVSHPVQTQAVTYIVQRAASLATLFYMFSLCCYIRARLEPAPGRGALYYSGSLAGALLAMTTKEMAITLPLIILLYEWCFLKGEKKFAWAKVVPFLMMLAYIPLLMLLTRTVDILRMKRTIEAGPAIPPGVYLYTQFRVILTYARLLFVPVNQNVDYDYPLLRTFWNTYTLTGFFFVAAILTAAIKLLSRYRIIGFSLLWFLITLLPESSIIPIKDVIFEHRLYLPMAGYSFFIAGVIYYFCQGTRQSRKQCIYTMCIVVGIYAVMACMRNAVWRDEVTLWSDAALKSPVKARIYHNLGSGYWSRGDRRKAILYYKKAIKLDGEFGDVYLSRAAVYMENGDYKKALHSYNKAIAINHRDFSAYTSRGLLYYRMGDSRRAIDNYTRAICLHRQYFQAYYNRGLAYARQKMYREALRDYDKALRINPCDAQACYDRGSVHAINGNNLLAIRDYTSAIKNDPRCAMAYLKRGNCFNADGQPQRAIDDYTAAIGLDPAMGGAYNNRAVVYFYMRDYTRSWRDVKEARSLGYPPNPKFIDDLRKAQPE